MDIERLINRHKDAVYRQMVRTCGNMDDAEDALAEALYAAIKAADQLKSADHFQAWLAKIGTRSCLRMRIRERLARFTSVAELEAKGIEFASPGQDPSEVAELAALKNCVAGAIELLPEAYREVYVQREIMGESAEDVARKLGISLPALKSRLHRAREMVREALDGGLGCRNLVETTPN
ncbi:MAG: RNA polymerase sigma factor [Armatimonadetes bacterium]|nr:RNA polymerase sigma factor [Armatimonadota bacterium]